MTIGPVARHVMRTIRECAGDAACVGWQAEFARAENTYQVDIAFYVGADHFAIMRSALRDRGCKLPLAAFRAERAEHEAWLSGDPAYPAMVADRAARAEFNGPVKSYTYETTKSDIVRNVATANGWTVIDVPLSWLAYEDDSRGLPLPLADGCAESEPVYAVPDSWRKLSADWQADEAARPVRAGTIAGHVIYKIKGARNDDELREREGCIQASIARRVGANELETIRAAILDRCARAGA